MSNYFDRFDPKPEADSGNPFDKFDAPVARRPQAAAGMSSAYRMAAKPKPQERTWGQAIGDAGAGVMSGLAGLVKTAGQLQGLAIGQPDNFVTRLGSDGQDWWRSLQSDALQAKRQARSEKIDQADGFFGQAGTAIKETVTDPALLTDLVAENITSLIPVGGAAQLGAKAGAKAATSGAARLGREVAKEAVERTAARWGTGAAIGTGAAMQGADVGGETYAELMQAGDEVWQGNAEYARRVAAGEDAAKVKHEMALSAARMAGAGAAGLSVATQALPGAATIERALAGRVSGASGIAGRALNATKGLGGEGLQEALEEGGGQLIGNFAKRPVANTPLMEGVGESAGLGFVAGGAMGGAIGALQYVGEQPRVAARPVPQTPPEEVNGMKLLAAPNGETPYGVNIVTPSGEVITPEMRGEDPRVTGEPASPVPNPDAVPGVRVHENSLRPQVGVPNPDAVPGSLSDAANAVAAVRTAARPVPQNDVARAPASEAAKSLGLHEIAEAVRMQHPDALNSVGTEAEPIARPRTNREGMFGRMLREQAEAKRRAEAEQAGAETPAGELARAALPSVLPWTNAETGEIRNPSDTELRNVMHGFMNRLQESGLGMRKTFLFNKLREMDGGLNGARLNAAYKEVQAERKRGLMQAEESQPQAGNSIAAQSDISGQPIGKVAAEDAPMPGASDGELLSKQPENNPESPVAAENLFSGEVKTEAPQGVQAEAPVKHSEMGQSDEHPVTMQNRDRSRAASVVQMQSIRSYPDPERLGFSRDPNAGAPMVGEGAQVAEADKGATDVVVMASGRRVPVRYAVVEADAVAASHNADGHVNPDYDDAALKALNNGRTAGLQAAWGAGNADAYREGIIADARLHGVSPEAIAGKKRPMLVRLYDPAANTGDMGAESNASAQLGLSPVEQAQTDSRTLPDMTGIQFAEDGSISPASNAAFFRAWFHNIGATQAATLQDAQGRPNAQALQRLKGALVYQAYGDERLLTALAEDVNPERRNVLNAMAQAAPAFAALEQDNTLAQEAKAALTGALELLRQAGERGLSVQDMVAQGDMLGRNAAAETVALFMAENARSAKRMAEAFRAIAEHVDNAQMAAATHDIFGNAPTPTLRDSLEYANDRLAQEQDENTRPARFDTARIDWPAARADAASGRGQGQSTGRGRSAAEDAGASTAPARLDDGQGQQVSDGLFGAPSARDHVDAARRAKDAARDGRTGTGRTDMMAGDGELFAGPRPEQVDIERQQDFSHLNALEYRLHNERQRLANAKTDREREWREVVVQGVEKEVRQERETLGLPVDVDAGATDIDALASALEDDNAAQSELKRSSRDEQQRGNETGVPRGLPAERTANSDRLEQGINRWRDREGHPGHLRIREVRAEALPDALRHALDRFHDATGTRIVLFRNLTPEVDDFNGVTFGDGTAYVNENNQYPLTLTAAHEWLHNLRRTNPGLYWELADEVARQGDLPGYQQRLKRDGEPRWRNMDLVAEELTAAAVSDALTDPEFLQRLATRNRGLFRRVAEAFLDFLNTLTRGWRDQGSNQYLQDVEAFRDKLAAVLDALPENGAASGAADIDVLFQRVWHGTPHRGIEKTGFKLNKIGTGEGAQAYGWGIYFASQKEVAEGYRQDLAATIAVDGKPLLVNNRRIGTTGDSDVVDKLESLRGKVQVQNQGQLYQVDIPEDSDLLDFDAPLSKQPPKVRKAIERIIASAPKHMRWIVDGIDTDTDGNHIYGTLGSLAHEMRFEEDPDGDGLPGGDAQAASELLREHGIPGLRYLDGDSRAAGKGSHNYVIWDEALLTPEAAQITPMFSRKKQLGELARQARAAGNENTTVDLGPVNTSQLELLRSEGLALDEGYKHTADMFAVRHALNRHSDAKIEKARGQLPLTDDDVQAIAEVVAAPDALALGAKTPRGQDVVGNIKRQSDGTILYIEEVRSGRKTLAMTSMRKYPGTSDFEAIVNSLLPTNARSDAGDVRIVYLQGEGGQGDKPAFSRKSNGPTPEARAEAERQFKATERAYGGRAAYDKAKADGKTKLTYGQWVQVRTPNFKQWFGDWEGLRAQEQLDEMRPVEVELPDSLKDASLQQLRDAVKARLDALAESGAVANHPEVGEISFSKGNNKKVVSTSAVPEKLHTAHDIMRVIESAVHVGSALSGKADEARREVAYHTLAAKVRAAGREFVAVVTVKEGHDGSRFYNTVAVDGRQEKAPAAYPGSHEHEALGVATAFTGAGGSVLPAMRRVNPAEVSKVIDPETGEPLVVYHGTNADFSVFDGQRSNSKSNTGVPEGVFFFTDDPEFASSYTLEYQGDFTTSYHKGGNVMPVFLNIRKPMKVNAKGENWNDIVHKGEWYTTNELADIAKQDRKKDGLIVSRVRDKGRGTVSAKHATTLVAFNPNQIKSATGNSGAFDPANDDIRFSRKAQTKAAYEARIDALFAGAKGNRQGVRILDRADMLDLLGHGDKPLHLVESAVGKKDSTGRVKHPGMTTEMWKRLPEWIENPVAAFESDTVDGRITLVAPDLVGGKPALVVLEPNGSMAGMDVHVAVNAYEKDNAAGVPTARWVRNGKLLYLDQKRSPTFSERSGLQLPRDVRQLRGYKHRVQTEADLHKYRAERDEAMFSRKPSNKRIASKPNEALADIEAAVREAMEAAEGKRSGPLLERARDKLADMTPAKVKDALRSTWLGALTLRHLTELGRDYFPTIGIYDDYRSRMSAHRNRLQQEANDVAEKVRDWAGKNVKAARALFDLMHDATIDGNDPAEEYKPLQFRYGGQLHEVNQKNVKEARKAIRQQMRDRSGDSKQDMLDEYRALGHMLKAEARRKKNYPALRQRWEALTKDAQQHYITMRDMYKARSEETEAALIARINDLEMENAGRKRVLINKIRQQFESQRLQGVYFPLQRYGQYFVAAEKSERSAFLMFDSLNKAEKAAKVLRAQGFTITASGKKGEGRASDAPSGTFVADVIEALRESKVSEATQDRIYQMYLEALPELSMRKHSIHRKAVPGFDPDAVRAFAHNMHHGAHQIARMHYAHKMSDTLRVLREQQEHKRRDPNADVRQVAAGDALLGELEKRDAWINNPQDSALTNMVSSFGFVYYLGASPAAALVNLTQTPLITYPYLAARYGATKAGRALAYAMKETTRTLGNAQAKLTDPDEIKALKRLQEIGALDKTQAHSLAGIAEGGLLGDNPKWRNAMEWIGIGFHKTEIMNREATGLATFRLARSAGASFDEAVQAASDAIFQTHYDYSNENRARFMQPGWAKVLLMFRQYSLNTTWHLARMVWQATKDADAETRKLARRNLAGILVMSSIFSGAMGLPMLKTVMGVLSSVAAVFGDDDEPWDAETEFAAFLSDMLGRDAARVVLHGAANAVTGADIASRVGLGELWIRDADRELDGRGEYFHLLEQVAGPLGGVLKNYFAGKSMIEDGKYWRGIETMLPKGLKDALKSARYATEGVNNLRGDPIVQDVSIRQLLLQFNGFTPAQVSEQYDTNNKLKNYEQYIRNRRQDLMNAIAMSIQKKDMSSRAKIVEKIKAFNRKYPEIAIDERAIRQSLMARARHSQNAEGGILLNQKLAPRVRDAVGV